jgi:hypothetical protein
MLPVLLAAGGALLRGGMIAATVGPLIKPAIRIGQKLLQKPPVRPGIGSKVTKGPLRVGKTVLMGPSMPGIGRGAAAGRAAGAAIAAGLGYAAVKRAPSPRPRTQPQPRPSRPPARAPAAKGTRKCCPVGTKRMVCFKRGRVKARKKSTRKPSAKQLANQRRFAAAARARRRG